jgi:beta-xylosidase
MRSALMSPKQYRDFAAQCLRWAAHARHEEHKSIMLQMADHWMQTAEELERAGTSRSAPSRMRLTSLRRDADRQEEKAAED